MKFQKILLQILISMNFMRNPRMILDRIILKSNEISERVWESRNEETFEQYF